MRLKHRILMWAAAYAERHSPSNTDPHEDIIGPNATFLGFVNPFAMPFGKMLLVVFLAVLAGAYLGLRNTVRRIKRTVGGLT